MSPSSIAGAGADAMPVGAVDVKETVALGTLPPGACTLQIGVTPDAGAPERKGRPVIQSVDFECSSRRALVEE